jgi:hypothetical protein
VAACLAVAGVWKLAKLKNVTSGAETIPAAKTPDHEEIDADENAAARSVLSELDFHELHGADLSDLAKWMVEIKQKGMLPISVTHHLGDAEPRFNAVAVKDPNAKSFRYVLDMPHQKLDHGFLESWLPNRPLASCAYRTGNELLQIGAYIPAKGQFPRWEGELEFIKAKLKEHIAPNQWRAADVQASAHPILPKTRIVIDFVPSTKKSEFAFDLSAAQVRARVPQMRSRETRPALLVNYGTKAPYQFILYEIDNSEKADWDMQLELSKPIFERELKQKSQQGLRPICIVSSGPKENSVYSCIWIRYKHP